MVSREGHLSKRQSNIAKGNIKALRELYESIGYDKFYYSEVRDLDRYDNGTHQRLRKHGMLEKCGKDAGVIQWRLNKRLLDWLEEYL